MDSNPRSPAYDEFGAPGRARARDARRYRGAPKADRSRRRAICGTAGAPFTLTKSAWRSRSPRRLRALCATPSSATEITPTRAAPNHRRGGSGEGRPAPASCAQCDPAPRVSQHPSSQDQDGPRSHLPAMFRISSPLKDVAEGCCRGISCRVCAAASAAADR
jgi:hypothetical protein